MAEIERINPQNAREKMKADQLLLVCAYAEKEKFEKAHLEGAISLEEFESRLPSLGKEQEVAFYCA